MTGSILHGTMSSAGSYQREPVRCGLCGKWHLLSIPQVSCCVAHPPDQCCHYMQKEVPEPQWHREQTP